MFFPQKQVAPRLSTKATISLNPHQGPLSRLWLSN
jgi:hypothetical protein